jgi:hypothetical protein
MRPGWVGCWAAKSIRKPEAPYWGYERDAGASQRVADVDLEGIELGYLPRRVSELFAAACRVLEVEPQQLDAACRGTVGVHVGV